jgi:ferrous-iron efflux pump FieF
LTLSEAHRISDTVEAQLLAAFPRAEVMIHQDPEGVDEPRRTFPPTRPSSKLAS